MKQRLIEAVKAGDFGTVDYLLSARADVNEGDERGWTALSFAAGKGDLAMVKLLLQRGADPFHAGRDNRTPYLIALAAGRAEVADYLRQLEQASTAPPARPRGPAVRFCQAFRLGDLRQFSGWSENLPAWKTAADLAEPHPPADEALSDEQVVFLHQDFTVTQSPSPNENIIFHHVSDAWREFALRALGFTPPTA